MGCVFIGPSSSSEIASFKISPGYSLMDGEDPVISGIDANYNYCGECEDVLESPTVTFDHVNPHNAAYRTVVVRNFWYSVQIMYTHIYRQFVLSSPLVN